MTKGLRILYLADIRFPLERANGIQTVETCDALAARGHDVELLVRPDTAQPPRDPFAFYGLSRRPTLRITYAPTVRAGGGRRLLYLWTALRRAFGHARDTVVLTRDLGVASALLHLPRSARPPIVFESHGFAPAVAEALPTLLSGARPASRRKRRRLSARERRVWREADAYVTITRALAADLTERFGTRRLLETIPDGVRIEEPRRFEPLAWNQTPLVAYAGHLYPWKGVDVLLRALALLPDVRGLVVGGHPDESDLPRTQELARELGLADRIDFVGWVAPASVRGHLARADLLVLPNVATSISSRYTSPLKLFEYLAAGKPIVGSDLPALREVLRPGENAVLVEAGSPDALAAGMRQVFEDRRLAERMARRAFGDARSYAWARRAARLEAMLDMAVRDASSGRARHEDRPESSDGHIET